MEMPSNESSAPSNEIPESSTPNQQIHPQSGFFERRFKLTEHKTTFSTEVIAGITTFMTMVYIVFVNPQILSAAGMDPSGVFVVTCMISALGCIAMGLIANLPIALAPAMGLNAFFAFSVVAGMGISWQTGMGTIFWGAVCFTLMSALGIRSWILSNIPSCLRIGIPSGIGLLIALVGLSNAGIVVASPATMITVGDLSSLQCVLGALGFFIIVILASRGIHAAVLISIVVVTSIAALMGDVEYTGIVSMPPSIESTFGQLDIAGSLDIALAGVIFSFALVSLFDSSGTMIGVTEKCGITDERGRFPRMKQALMTDSVTSVAGAYMGTSTVTAYIESSAGVAVGGRTGLTAIVAGLLFIVVIFFSPLAAMVPGYAVAGALIYVGILMSSGLAKVKWDDMTEAAPAFITTVMMPFSFSITEGIATGFITYCVMKAGTNRWREIHPGVAIVALLFIIKFVFVDGH
ncbi:NCS2 family permease [Photobacterium lutimaris]|uniref:Adenine permease PurP n=1 Tax=Photobacterium lutimaris TaxID=388278 RepID=A0A2T3IXD7_9GAMM|nr:NCS2 family permease [Photobacterium lutimaris]PSU33182.1 adenine permease PurP [Photobacterium lutimaris]TDR75241.1 AGZA family xanthine/uracil permease-like MFS transporter [Photobacterium lutimaris]